MAKVPGLQLDDRIFNSDLYESIEAFWFEGLPPGATTPPYSLTARWFGLGSQTEKDQFNSTCRSVTDTLGLIPSISIQSSLRVGHRFVLSTLIW